MPFLHRTSHMLLAVAVIAGALSGAVLAQHSQHAPKAIVVDRYVTPDGTISDKRIITLSNGKIAALLPHAEIADKTGVAYYSGAVACPGLIDVRSSMGAYGNTVESAFSVDPSVSAIDSFDPDHRDFRRAVESGITAALIAPSPTNLVAGACAVVKTGGASTGRAGSVLRDDGPLVFGFGPRTWRYDRAPTSRIGAMAMLRSVLGEAKSGSQHARLQSLASGKLDAMLYCSDAMDVGTALRSVGKLAAHTSIIHTSDVYDLTEELAGTKATMIVGPYSFSMSQRTLSMAGVLASAGIDVALAGQMPTRGGHSLRQTAALAVRYGMDSAKARQAITINAAKAAGVSDRVGAIRPGMDADLVIFSGDPLRMDSRVLAVYIDGIRVYSADQHLTMSAGGQR